MMQCPLSRKDSLVVQQLKDELLIYDLKTNKAYCLNQTSALVWEACDGTNPAHEISSKISQKLKSPVPEDLVWLALDDLRKTGLIYNDREIKNEFSYVSRRALIKRIGLTSMIALPIISSLVAPTAAHAASNTTCLNENETCNGSVPCCAGFECNPSCGFCVPSGGLGGCL